MSKRGVMLGLLIVLMLVLSIFISNHFIFIVLSILSIYLGVSQFLIDKKERDSAINYCRKDWIVWKHLLQLAVMLVIIISLPLLGFGDLLDNLFSFYAIFAYFGGILASIHQDFFNSIRTYSDGFKMPGRKSELVPWSEVEKMSVIGESLEIKSSSVSEIIAIDRRDLKYLPKIVKTWEESVV